MFQQKIKKYLHNKDLTHKVELSKDNVFKKLSREEKKDLLEYSRYILKQNIDEYYLKLLLNQNNISNEIFNNVLISEKRSRLKYVFNVPFVTFSYKKGSYLFRYSNDLEDTFLTLKEKLYWFRNEQQVLEMGTNKVIPHELNTDVKRINFLLYDNDYIKKIHYKPKYLYIYQINKNISKCLFNNGFGKNELEVFFNLTFNISSGDDTIFRKFFEEFKIRMLVNMSEIITDEKIFNYLKIVTVLDLSPYYKKYLEDYELDDVPDIEYDMI